MSVCAACLSGCYCWQFPSRALRRQACWRAHTRPCSMASLYPRQPCTTRRRTRRIVTRPGRRLRRPRTIHPRAMTRSAAAPAPPAVSAPPWPAHQHFPPRSTPGRRGCLIRPPAASRPSTWLSPNDLPASRSPESASRRATLRGITAFHRTRNHVDHLSTTAAAAGLRAG